MRCNGVSTVSRAAISRTRKRKAALTDISNHKQGVFDRACGCPQHATVVNRYMVVGKDGNLGGTTSTDKGGKYRIFHDEDLPRRLCFWNAWSGNGLSSSRLLLQQLLELDTFFHLDFGLRKSGESTFLVQTSGSSFVPKTTQGIFVKTHSCPGCLERENEVSTRL